MKKWIARIVTIIMLTSCLSQLAYGNIQIQVDQVQVDEVYYVEGENAITGEPMIRPTIQFSWENPENWSVNPVGSVVHEPDYYDIVVNNLSRGKENTIRVNDGSEAFDNLSLKIHNEMNLDTGSLYNIQVEPNHYHTIDGGTGVELAPISGVGENAYAITDLDVDFVSNEDSIQVIWDDLGVAEFTYRIVYAIGDYSNRSKQELLNNKEGEVTGLTMDSDDVTRYYDPIEKRNKLTYTLDNNIYPGQVYSVLVEPTTDYYNSQPIMRNRNYPVIRTCSTNVQLDLFEEGDYLRLEWEVPPSFKVGQDQEEYELVEATLLQYEDGQASNVVIFDGDSATIGYYKVLKSQNEVDYEIQFVYQAVDDQTKIPIEPISNKAHYVPSELRIQPTKPYVPNLYSKSILEDLRETYDSDEDVRRELSNNYLIPGYTYSERLDDLINEDVTYHLDADGNNINLVWEAFQRIDVDETSDTYGVTIYDNNIYYDIWVTDSIEALNYATKTVDDQRYDGLNADNLIKKGEDVIGYKQSLSHFYDDETGELVSLVPNQLYYIKIVAKKKVADGELVSEPTIVTLYYGYDGDVFAPPTLVKPPLEVKEEDTTVDGVSIIWEESWWEAISPDVADDEVLSSWEHNIWVEEDGTIHREKVEEAEHFAFYACETSEEAETEAKRLEDYLAERGQTISIQVREVDLGKDEFGVSNVKYKFLKIPYEKVQEDIAIKQKKEEGYSFSDYYYELIENDNDGTNPLNWQDIEPTSDIDDVSKLLYREEGLLPNTSYLFMVYPYREAFNGDLLYAHYPAPIIVATNAEGSEVTPDPTVPNLYVSNYTDTSISVSWKYNRDFQYELVYSLYEDVSTAVPVEWSLPESIYDPLYPVDGEYYEVEVDDLFPNTDYYFWIRATQSATGNTSQWSNATLGTSRDVSPPIPPRGVGIASKEKIKPYNFDESVTNEYFIVEWILDEEDQEPEEGKEVIKTYSYIVEVAENPQFIDPIYIHSTGGTDDIIPDQVEILEKNLIKVNDLIPNRNYYIRVKTRLIVTGSIDNQLIEKDSLFYSPTIRIRTSGTSDEYDGTIDPELEVLPEEVYELIYDSSEDSLEYRFRESGIDEDGSRDNFVHQLLINQLIEENQYSYFIDIAEYHNRDIDSRKITIPYSVMEAFDEYKISISIDAEDVKIVLPYRAIASEIQRQVDQYGVAPTIEIIIESLDYSYLENGYPDPLMEYTIDRQWIEFRIISDRQIQTISYTDRPIQVQIATGNPNAYIYTQNHRKNWVKMSHDYDSETGFSEVHSSNVGAYVAGILDDQNDYIYSDNNHWSEVYREEIFTRYHIDGLDQYDPDAKVTEAELVNIIYGITMQSDTIDLDNRITDSMMKTIQQAGIKKNNSYSKTSVSREEAISMFTRVYEILNDTIIQPDSLQVQKVNNQKDISDLYKDFLAKAGSIGLISSVDNVRPKDDITYGELFTLWAK